jgi:hypothetical protein
MNVLLYIKGDAVLLKIKRDTLVVDAGNKNVDQVKTIATKFFKEAYMLGK